MDRGHAERGIGIEAIPHGEAPQAGTRTRVVRDRAEQLVERRAACLDVPGQQLPLGRPIALAHRERRHLGPQQQQPAELDVPLRRVAASGQFGGREVPRQAPDLGTDAEEQDQPSTLSRRDRAGLVLQGQHGREIEPPAGERALADVDQLVERLGVDGVAEGAGIELACGARPERSIAAWSSLASAPTSMFRRASRTRARRSLSESTRSAGSAAITASTSGRARSVAVRRVLVPTVRGVYASMAPGLLQSGNPGLPSLPSRAMGAERLVTEHSSWRKRPAAPRTRSPRSPRAAADQPILRVVSPTTAAGPGRSRDADSARFRPRLGQPTREDCSPVHASQSTAQNGITAARLGLALLVVVSHSFVLTGHLEPLVAETGQLSLGFAAVLGFFGLSGWLLAGSRLRTTPLPFLRNRALRIYPRTGSPSCSRPPWRWPSGARSSMPCASSDRT